MLSKGLLDDIVRQIASVRRDVDNLTFPEVVSSGVGGSGAIGQVAYWTGAVTLAGDPGFMYDAATDTASLIGAVPSLDFVGALNADTITVLLVDDAVANDSDLAIRLCAADSDSQFQIQDNTTAVVTYIDADGNADFEGHIAVGASGTVNTARVVNIREIYTDVAGTRYGLYASTELAPGANFTTVLIGFEGFARLNDGSTQTAGRVVGLRGNCVILNGQVGTINEGRGIWARVDAEDGTITTGQSIYAEMPTVDSGSMTDAYGIYLDQVNTGVGTITNFYGLWIDNVTNGTAINWAIYTNTGDCRFGDAVHIVDYLYHDGDPDTYLAFFVDAIDIQAGGVQFLTIVEDGVQDKLIINEGGVDVDVRIEAVGHTDALIVQGSDGQITLGVLGAGAVQSDAAGVLSSGPLGPAAIAHTILDGSVHTDSAVDGVTRGSIIIGNSTPLWDELILGGAAGSFLRRDATDVMWSTLVLPNAATTGDILYASAANTISRLADVAVGQVLASGGVGVAPAYSASPTVTGITLSGLTASTVIYSNAAKAITSLANAVGYLYNNGAGVLSYVAAPVAAAHNILSAIHGDTVTAAVVRGDLMTGQAAVPKWTRLAKGTQYQVLTGGALEPTWGAVALNQPTAVSGTLPSLRGGTGVSNAGTITNANNTTITGGGTISLGGFTLTVPATGTAVLGTGAANRVAYWSGANNVTGDAGLLVDAANDLFVVADDGGIGISNAAEKLEFFTAGYALFSGCNVGIGAVPGTTLDVNGTITSRSSDSMRRDVDNANILISGGTATNVGANLSLFGSTHATLPNVVRFRASGTDTMYIDASGNVGIGRAPTEKLDIYHATDDINCLLETDKVNGQAYYEIANDAQAWAVGINASDNFLISDTTGAATKLAIYQATGVVHLVDGGRTAYSAASAPPTDAELDAAFGLPANLGDGYFAVTYNSGSTLAYWCMVANGQWWWGQGFLAA